MEERALAGVLLHFRVGHESLDVTLAYLKGAESEEAQEHANSSSMALYG